MEPLIAKANEEFLPIPGPPCERAMIAAPSGNDRYLRSPDGWSRRILFSNGVKGGRLFVVDALGCLCSLRARSALDGVSWVQGG